MPVQPPWTPDVDTIVGVAITVLVVLVVQVASWYRARRRHMAVQPSPWRPSGAGDQPHDEPDVS